MSERRDWLRVATYEGGQIGRALTRTPHEIAVLVAHEAISYGQAIERCSNGYVLERLKRAIFRAVRDTIVEATSPSPEAHANG